MRPLVITLPNQVRDALEAALTPVAPRFKPDDNKILKEAAAVSAAGKIVSDLMYTTRLNGKEKKFFRDFRETLLKLETGNGHPAVMLKNLPPRQGQLFIAGLAAAMSSDMRERIGAKEHINDTNEQEFHSDDGDTDDSKSIRLLYCKNPGARPVPTIFVTLDEAIHAHACLKLGLPVDTPLRAIESKGLGDIYRQQQEGFIVKLRAYKSLKFCDNPNHTITNGAPRYFIESHVFIRSINPELRDDLDAAYDSLRPMAIQQSVASTKANTAVIFNNALVKHARAAEAVDGRLLIAYGINAAHAMTSGHPAKPPGEPYVEPVPTFADEALAPTSGHWTSRHASLAEQSNVGASRRPGQ